MKPIIQVNDLCKSYRVSVYQKSMLGLLSSLFNRKYKQIEAVSHISFSVEQGECVGFIGQNGAGKSTTIKMMTGVLSPTSGSVLVDGIVPYQDRQKNGQHIGVVFGQRSQLWNELPVIDSFELLKEIYRIADQKYRDNVQLFSEKLGLDEFLHQPVRKLSLGQRMRAEFAAALLHDPKVLFLDEPTICLDVFAKEAVREFIRYVNTELGTTIILTSHDMNDIEHMCNRVIIIDKGKVVQNTDVATLKSTFANMMNLTIEMHDARHIQSLAQNVELLNELSVKLEQATDTNIVLEYEPAQHSAYSLANRINPLYPIKDIKTTEMEIEKIIRRIYQEA